MLGAIIGDIVGSRFEWNNHRSKDFEFLTYKCFPTDDSIMSLAIAQAILVSKKDYSDLSKNAIECMQNVGRNYPNCGYGGSFYGWIFSDDPKPYNSYGNGAAMRVSAAGFAANSIEEAKKLSRLVTEVSHNHPEGIKGAEATVVAIFMAKTGSNIFEIRDYIDKNYYPMNFTWHTPDHKAEGSLADVKISVADMITPEKIMDIMQFFTVFSTDKKHRKIKVICRYQQYEAANLMIDRVKAGYPKQGLIWHFQGSGKSLLMVFAAQKLRMMPELQNPTVVIVDDRIDLETQITGDFNAADIPNLQSLSTKEDLMNFFEQDMRKIAITTIYRFGDVEKALNMRDNIILMVDEAHRTQEGDYGEKMRLALPNAFFFGLTGTPINRLDKNTFKTFGAIEDKSGYMSKYSFSDSIRDNATLPLNFEPVPIDLHVDKEKLDQAFDEMTDGLSDEDKGELSKNVTMKAIMYDRKRIKKVVEHIVNHYKTKIEPNGYKAQIVVYDRECCLMYKEELDKLVPPESSTIVMTTGDDKAGRYKQYKRSRDEEAKVLDQFREPSNPLKFVIVTNKLLTGFDAPILQVMYLDKPMKDHNLLQAICRVNRTYDVGKTNGLIVDYIGIFDNVAKALNFDEAGMKKVVTNIEEVKKQVPAIMRKCLSYFMGVDRTVEGWEGLLAAQECMPNNKIKDEFAADYRVLNRAWNALSPDPFLEPFKYDYVWLSKVYESVKPTDSRGQLVWAALGAKTLELVHQHIEVGEVHDDVDILTLDAALRTCLTKRTAILNSTINIRISY